MKHVGVRGIRCGAMWKILSASALWLFPLFLSAQELDCKVTVNHAQVQGTNVQVFKTLETALTEFITGHKHSTRLMNVFVVL